MSELPALEDLYDPDTLALIDRGYEASLPTRPRPFRATAASGAMVAALALGIQEIIEPSEAEPEIVEIEPDGRLDAGEAVRLHFVPDDPPASRAVVMAWLL